MKCKYCGNEAPEGRDYCDACLNDKVDDITLSEKQLEDKQRVQREDEKRIKKHSIISIVTLIGMIVIIFAGYNNLYFNSELTSSMTFDVINHLGAPNNWFINGLFLLLSGLSIYGFYKQTKEPYYFNFFVYISQVATKGCLLLNAAFGIFKGAIFQFDDGISVGEVVVELIAEWFDVVGILLICLFIVFTMSERELFKLTAKKYKKDSANPYDEV